MKLVVVGLGQCGGRIADEFARLNQRARSRRGLDVINGTYAVNTDAADLSGLTNIKKGYQNRVLIGGRKTGGHGVGKINELGAEIAKDDADKVIDAIRTTKRFFETDAFLCAASAAGGTGSGAIAVITKHLKERYVDKPVYDLVVLPFEHEETTEERTIYNTATCLKSCYSVADAVFLVDNQRYVRKDASIRNNMNKINSMIVDPFYNILCAGEEKKSKFIGGKLLDAGDIIQTLVGWTSLGYGKSEVPLIRLPFDFRSDFRKKGSEIQKGIQAMDEAISELSLKCNPVDARRALYLISGPARELNMDLVKELGDYMRDICPEAIIRNGDYPREKGAIDVSVILSELSDVEKIRDYYSKSTSLIPEFVTRQKETGAKLKEIEEASKDIPSLL
ncbi:MAG: tubulin/FtsZ family protein [Chloroflexota bacterium]